MAPFSKTFSPPLSPDGMIVETSNASHQQQHVSPLQDPFFYANIIQRAEKSTEFRETGAAAVTSPPMMNDTSVAVVEGDDCAYDASSYNDEEDLDSLPPPAPKRRMSRNNFATVIQRLSSITMPVNASHKKSVRFPEEDSDASKCLLRLIREIESHRDFSTRERNRCWWSPSEKEKCMSKHERVVSRMEHRKPCRKHETYRGLESWTSQGAAKLDQVINVCVDAVMDEQDHQWRVHKDDFERIAAISQRATVDSAKRARHVGLKDEREALLVRNQNWVEDDEMTIHSAMGASVMTAIKRKKKLATLRDKRDPGAKKLSKRMRKSSSTSNKDKHNSNKHTSTSGSTSSTLEKKIHKSGSSGASTSGGGAESVKSSSKNPRSDRSHKSSSKKESSSSSKSRSKSKSRRESRDKDNNPRDKYERSSSNSSISSSKKKRSHSSSKHGSSSKDGSSAPTPTRGSTRQNNTLTISGTPPTSFSSTSSSVDETSPLAAAIIRQSNHKSQICQNKNKTTSSSNHSSGSSSKKGSTAATEPLPASSSSSSTAAAGGKMSDPPGRRATRCKSSHADKTLLTMKSQASKAAAASAAATKGFKK